MNRFDNPFHDLWITEILNPEEFVKMFSPHVAAHAEDLFSTGNVVVRGRQGSGKSMLLGLLNTKTRVAYARAGEKYPAPDRFKAFIAAGINLTRDNARIVVSRLSELPVARRRDWAATTFADYINYLLVHDLLQNVKYLAAEQKRDSVLEEQLSINWSESNLDTLANMLKSSDAWYGYLSSCNSIEDIQNKISYRISEYRRFFNFNVENLDAEVESTKTDIGEPIAVLADCLRLSGILPSDALVFLKIDQHEELYELENSSGYGEIFRRVINRALAMRDGRVSYRVGTRHYAWMKDITVWGSGASLENMRDYSLIDIDSMLRRDEHPSSSFSFPKFAEDVFARRLKAYFKLAPQQKTPGILKAVFGDSLTPAERARLYAKQKSPKLQIPDDWSPAWRIALESLWKVDPLDAKLGEAWLRQKAQQQKGIHKDASAAVDKPWLDRPYWRKERNEAALIQIAGDTNEMLMWSGERHLLDLAGWNILAFMTICRAVWAAWLRRTSAEELQNTQLPNIGADEQVIGVHEASRIWAEKLKEGTVVDRATFIKALGSWFSSRIRADRALSNPGHNGISILESEFNSDHHIAEIIRQCRDQGDLIESPHTTKESNAKPRIKWYLNPLLCPYFRIPHVRTKEPIYTSLAELERICIGGSGAAKGNNDNSDPKQSELF